MKLSILVIAISAIFIAGNSYSKILFEDNFNSTSDWQSAQTPNKSCGNGADITWWATACVEPKCPPRTSFTGDEDGYYDLAYFSSDSDCDSVANQLFLIADGYGRNGTKGVRQKVQGDGYGNWNGGRISIRFEGAKEIYLGFWAKFQKGFSFGPDSNGQMKWIDVSSYPPEHPANVAPNMATRFSDGLNQPISTFIWYSNRAYDSQFSARTKASTRGAPKYCSNPLYCPGVADNTEIVDVWPNDGAWHFYEMRAKLNSLPGVADGGTQLWIDGRSVYNKTEITFVMPNEWISGKSYVSSTPGGPEWSYIVPKGQMKGFMPVANHTSGGTEPDWSSAINIGDMVADGNGNQWKLITFFHFNSSFLFDNHYLGFEDGYVDQFVYYDDLVVSTEYIEPTYIINSNNSGNINLFPPNF